jgi:hypothetical protein
MPVKPLAPEDLAHVLTHTREHWSEAKGSEFCISGAVVLGAYPGLTSNMLHFEN